MRSALRRMGNSTGLILPKLLLEQAGVGRGAVVELTVENGAIVATPVREAPRAGWAEAAAQIGRDELSEDEAGWASFGLQDEADLKW